MKLIPFIFSFFMSCSALWAQQLTSSPAYSMGRDRDCFVLGQIDSLYYVYREGPGKEHGIHSFRMNLEEEWEATISYKRSQVFFMESLQQKDRFQLIYAMYFDGNTEIRMKEIGAEGQELADEALLLFKYFVPYRDLRWELSQDKSELLVFHKVNNREIEWGCYNLADRQLRWEYSLTDFEIKNFKRLEHIVICNSGQALLLFEFHNRLRREDHHFLLFSISAQGERKKHKIDFAQAKTDEYLVDYDELNQQLLIGGLYYQSGNEVEGLFYLRYDMQEEALLKFHPFPDTLIRSLTGQKRKNLRRVEYLRLRELIPRRDGGILLVAERYRKYNYNNHKTSYQDHLPAQQMDYLYENILLSSIHPSGQLHRQEVLFKQQKSENDEGRYSSFFLMKTARHLRFIYNDEIRYLGRVYEYTVDASGQAERQRLFGEKRSGVLPEFQRAKQVSAKTTLAISKRNNKFRLVRLSYD